MLALLPGLLTALLPGLLAALGRAVTVVGTPKICWYINFFPKRAKKKREVKVDKNDIFSLIFFIFVQSKSNPNSLVAALALGVSGAPQHPACPNNAEIALEQRQISSLLTSIQNSLEGALLDLGRINATNERLGKRVLGSKTCLEMPPILFKSLGVLKFVNKFLSDVDRIFYGGSGQDYAGVGEDFFDLRFLLAAARNAPQLLGLGARAAGLAWKTHRKNG